MGCCVGLSYWCYLFFGGVNWLSFTVGIGLSQHSIDQSDSNVCRNAKFVFEEDLFAIVQTLLAAAYPLLCFRALSLSLEHCFESVFSFTFVACLLPHLSLLQSTYFRCLDY